MGKEISKTGLIIPQSSFNLNGKIFAAFDMTGLAVLFSLLLNVKNETLKAIIHHLSVGRSFPRPHIAHQSSSKTIPFSVKSFQYLSVKCQKIFE